MPREGWSEQLEAQKGEGCQVYGHLLVNKVAGNFHFAPGKSFQQNHMHVHGMLTLFFFVVCFFYFFLKKCFLDLQPFNMPIYNVSHIINRLSFGQEFPGVINPLDSVSKTSGNSFFFVIFYWVFF